MVNDEDVVCDIVQEIFVFYFEKLQDGFMIHHPQSWLVRATINKCIDHLNQRKKHTQLSAVSQFEAEEETIEIQSPDVMLKQALAMLKPGETELVILYSEGYSYKEIALITGINFSSVGKMLSRTLHKLKGVLKRLNYELY